MIRTRGGWKNFVCLVLMGWAALFAQGFNDVAEAKVPTVTIGDGNIVKLEVAASEAEIERGLMGRTSLPEDQGMVFLFHPARPVEFWMFHCFIPLDMVFVKDGKIVKIIANVPPCTSPNPRECPRYSPGNVDISEVIELSAGYAERHKVKEGDPVKFNLP